MKRNAILGALLLAASCSGGSGGGTRVTGGTLGSTRQPGGGPPPGAALAAADPFLPFRQQYSNPGGMWTPAQMTLPGHVEVFQKMGVKLDPKVLSDPLAAPLAAIVALGGCSASFVSPQGLIVTNHHCVQGALQLNSTPENNLVENGFLAKTMADERSAGPAERVYVAQAFKDVTKEMRDGLDKIADPSARRDESEKRLKQLIAACEKDRPGIRCQVSSFFRGDQFVLIENLELRDVRLVYAPSRPVGVYGGEIDNWAWPRHCGDFSFYRAYVGKDGKPADYAKDNVPYQPKHYLKVSAQGLRAGDFVMVTGYPSFTSRTETALETHQSVEWFYPYQIALLKEHYKIADEHERAGGETAIKARVKKQGVQNDLENLEGTLKGLTSGDLLQRKHELDRKVKAWAAQPGREAHKQAIEKVEKVLTERFRTARADFERDNSFAGSRLLATALRLTRWAEERPKKDADRKPGYQDRDLQRAIAGHKQFAKQYDRKLDRAGFRLALVRALALPEADRTWLPLLLDVKAGTKIDEPLIDKTLDAWYGAQQLEDEKLRVELVQKGTTAQLKASKDPFLRAAQRIWPLYRAEEKKREARGGELLLIMPYYAEAMREVLGGLLAPDANGTLRITYGTVRSFKPASQDPADRPFTTGAQIIAKDTGKEPFDAPAKLLEALKAKRYGAYADAALGGELPVNFLTDLDTTGGNSGSATLNDKGELVGLIFDGTIEGVASDVVFNGATTRAIHVDARYMLWMMDLLDGADHLVTEMGVAPQL